MLTSGHTVGDYRIVKPLEENQLFTTYQVTGPVVETAKLLLLDVEQLVDKKSRQAFIAQAQRLCGQSFPGICSLLAADSNDEYSYCVYPLAKGTSVNEWLEKGFSLRESLELVRATANSLSPAHESGLWHGALSPATILLDQQGVYLDQFALASLLQLDFNSGIDPRYSSPELVRGEPLSPAADLYSLGILLCRLLTGSEPFVGDEPFATAMLHLQQQAEPLPTELALLQPLLDNLLLPVPGDRWNADRLIAEIDQLLQLPEIDLLSCPQPATENESVEQPAEDKDLLAPQEEIEQTVIEAVSEQSDMAARIEQRLQQRAEALQQSADLTPDNKRASSARMSAIGQQSYRKSQNMNSYQTQKTGGLSRFVLLVALGIAVGVAIYLLLFSPQNKQAQVDGAEQQALLDGLQQGSLQLAVGDTTTAEQTFVALAQDYPMAPQPYNNLAAIAASSGNLEQARELLERAMATDQAYATVYRNLGTVYSEMARDSYGRALQLEKGEQVVSLQLFGGDQLMTFNATATTTEKGEPAEESQIVAAVKPEVVPPAPVVDEQSSAVTEVPEEEPEPVVEQAETVVVESIDVAAEEVVAVSRESAEEFLQRWALAWSNQDVSSYLAFYSDQFLPSSGIGLEEWELQRQTRLTRPKTIEVTLSDFSLLRESGDQQQIEVTQEYRSDRYQDRTRKRFDLVQTEDSWLIVRERSLGRAR
ncbi:Serine/threonine protein kinase [Malonomonas rubra DSM 5091]|uniref:non-specific serine/threonine protein kinase n=1 Tax=Malonomonas rubra DSM 5091 TaxID=1122189 RepID=A0A1M6CEG8_MALRU|nr:protein kinase [Malonomonas rubra]SHI59420.1 Serine/threonine protein kinase [Malonomonas rubra DSM 5091]